MKFNTDIELKATRNMLVTFGTFIVGFFTSMVSHQLQVAFTNTTLSVKYWGLLMLTISDYESFITTTEGEKMRT